MLRARERACTLELFHCRGCWLYIFSALPLFPTHFLSHFFLLILILWLIFFAHSLFCDPFNRSRAQTRPSQPDIVFVQHALYTSSITTICLYILHQTETLFPSFFLLHTLVFSFILFFHMYILIHTKTIGYYQPKTIN